ncbi:glutathione peroxidase [Streptomyces sp. ST2-7A]|uniref:glutathione peroxidase n=1 Tax=Streptomyces sp. ST2-7A TaxID=2907214 RepID=UPI001F2225A4|nr:glutathione peroxidase [Streptomyces sp. ST2-7A]MCE7079554.1 glutathione peroxidase [Streptomyces sp. ST2-7A]
MTVFDIAIAELNGREDLPARHRGHTLLIVNVASQCALAGQCAGLEELTQRHREDGLAVIGVPCNQFGEQEPGTHEEIAAFCSVQRISFPLTEKIDVNGANRHPLYTALTPFADAEGHTGDVRWNFEKFLVSSTGEPAGRFGPTVDPRDPELLRVVRAQLR